PFGCSLRTRFSAAGHSRTSCWWRLTHPARVTSSSRKGERSAIIGRSYRATFGAVPGTGSAEYSDTTGLDLTRRPLRYEPFAIGHWPPALLSPPAHRGRPLG